MKKYNQYSVEDFVLDDGFRMWVLSENPENDAFWREWITRHPGMSPVINEARQIILGLQSQEASASQEEIDAGYREIEAFFDRAMERQNPWISKGFWKIAASILALIVAGLGILFQNQPQDKMKQYVTQEGEHEKIELPDGSRVYMKENSRLSYSTDWNDMRKRQVQLKGEAYFQVREQIYQGNQVKFVVQANGLSVEVVGTEFVVNNRSSRTHIALNSGKIRLKLERNNRVLNMSPGDVVEYDASSNKLLSRRRDVGPSDSWLKNFEESGSSRPNTEPGSGASMGVTRGVRVNQNPDKTQVSQPVNVPSIQADPSTDKKQTAKASNQENAPGSTAQRNLQITSKGSSSGKQGGSMQVSRQNYILQPVKPDNSPSTNNMSQVRQQGEENTAYIEQIGDNLASKQDQEGNRNQATASIQGSKDGSDDLDWSSWQKQKGSDNVSIFSIVESYNSNMYSMQEGRYNAIDALSRGEDNTSIILQYGEQNDVMIRQYGAGNEIQGMDPLAPGVMQKGSFNEVDIIQHGSRNQTRTIQRGQNNEINVNQNGN